jgi:putative ABC transport system permease protein
MGLISCVIAAVVVVGAAIVLLLERRLVKLIVKNLRRNLQRTLMTSATVIGFAIMVTLIWSVVAMLDQATEDKAQDIKLIVTERWQLPSQMPRTHGDLLNPDSRSFMPELQGLVKPGDYMTWAFYGGSTDVNQITFESLVFFFTMNPDHIKSMMDNVEDVTDEEVRAMKQDVRKCLLGRERMEKLHLKVGDRFKLYSMNYKGIDLEFEVAGELGSSAFGLIGIMNDQYLYKALDTWKTNPNNKSGEAVHPLADKCMALIWLRVRDKDAYTRVAHLIESSPKFAARPVKVETASSGIAAFLDPYRDLLWGIKWLLVPAILISMTLVISNAIAITVRERRTEMAVMKVLGFRPTQIQILVLGEAIMVGSLSGLLATGGAYVLVDWIFGGVPFPIAFFPAFMVPAEAVAWGFAIGAAAGIMGSFLPALTARSVKVSEVFARVA